MKKKNKSKEKVPQESFLDCKYQNLYMILGNSIGMSLGIVIGRFLFHNTGTGMCFGLGIGMCLGIALGAAKDKQIAEKAQVIADILEEDFGCEGVPDDAQVTVTLVLTDIHGAESRYPVSEALANEKNLRTGDRIYIDPDGNIEKYKREDA